MDRVDGVAEPAGNEGRRPVRSKLLLEAAVQACLQNRGGIFSHFVNVCLG
jgi:hypothetical protein